MSRFVPRFPATSPHHRSSGERSRGYSSAATSCRSISRCSWRDPTPTSHYPPTGRQRRRVVSPHVPRSLRPSRLPCPGLRPAAHSAHESIYRRFRALTGCSPPEECVVMTAPYRHPGHAPTPVAAGVQPPGSAVPSGTTTGSTSPHPRTHHRPTARPPKTYLWRCAAGDSDPPGSPRPRPALVTWPPTTPCPATQALPPSRTGAPPFCLQR